MYSKYDPQYDSFDSRAEQARQIEESEDHVRAFEALSEDEQENVIQAERLAFLAAEAVTPMTAAKAWAASQLIALKEVA